VSETEAADPANAVVEGTATVTVESGAISPVRVVLRAKAESGAGTLMYDLRFPANAESAVLYITPISAPGNRQERDLKTAALPSGDNVSRTRIEIDNLPAGYYRLGLDVSVYDSGEGRTLGARKTIVAHIYDGLTTTVEETLGSDSFASVQTFTGIATLSSWLAGAEENTKDTPYRVALRELNVETDFAEGDDPLGKLYNALNGKYVALDLSGCATGEKIGDATSAVAYARKDKDHIVSLALPATLKAIGDYGFYNCVSLLSVDWPFSAAQESIGNYAFSGCVSLASVELPGRLETIGNYAFQNCSSLRELSLPEGLTQIGNYTFQNCSSLRELSLPADLTQIGNYAFENCRSLRELTLSAGLTQIGYAAFRYCSSLRELSLPADLTQIGDFAFENCSSLRELTLSAGLTQIGNAVFRHCSSLQDLSLPADLTQIGADMFANCTSLREIALPAGLTTIGASPFLRCSSLEKVSLSADFSMDLTSSLFTDCASLSFQVAPENTTYSTDSSGKMLFKGTVLVCGVGASGKLSLPEGITEISAYAFSSQAGLSNNSSLTSVILPSTLTTINQGAFYNVHSLEKVFLPANLTYIGNQSFYGNSLRVVILEGTTPPSLAGVYGFPTNSELRYYVPAAAVDNYKDALNWSNGIHINKIVDVATLASEDDPSAW
jgi:hypothetical protein